MSEDIRITIDRDVQPIPAGNFNLPLILAQSGDGVAEELRTYSRLPEVEADYVEEDNPRIVQWAREMFRAGAGELAIYNVTRDGTEPTPAELTDALDAIADESFFYVTITSREDSATTDAQGADGDRDAVATWCQDNERKFIAANNVSESAADIATAIGEINLDQTHFVCFENAGEELTSVDHPVDAALAGRLSAYFPGSINFKFQEFTGIPGSDYSLSEINTIEDAGGNVYRDKKGISQTSAALSTDNETFSDIPIIEMWLEDNIISRIYRLLVDENKVPYTNVGVEMVESAIRGAFEEGIDEDVLVEYNLTSPDTDEQTVQDRADRILGDFEFVARLSGAVNEVEITGVITA